MKRGNLRWDEQALAEYASKRSRFAATAEGNKPESSSPPAPTAGRGTLQFVIPFPPTVNHSTAPNGKGGRYLTDAHRTFREQVRVIARHATPLEGRIAVTLVLYPKDRRHFDIDNRCKAVLDALNGYAFGDDSQIDQLTIERADARPETGGCAVVTVTPL